MYIELNPEKIFFDFNPYFKISIDGPDQVYYIELREYEKNDSNSKIIESYEILSSRYCNNKDWFTCFIEFKCDLEFSVFKFIDGIGLKRIHTHRFSEYQQNIKINIHSQNEEFCNLAAERIDLYRKLNNCFVCVDSNFDNINNRFDFSPKDEHIDFYKTYNLGRFPKTSIDFRSTNELTEGFIYLGNWKKFWSYQHPKIWVNLNPQQIIDDILGLSE